MKLEESGWLRAEEKPAVPLPASRELPQRFLTGLCLIVPAIYLAGFAPSWLFVLAVLAAIQGTLYEYFQMLRQARRSSSPALGYLGGLGVGMAQLLEMSRPGWGMRSFLALLVLLLPPLVLRQQRELNKGYLPTAASTLLGVFYIGLGLSWLIPLRLGTGRDGGMLVIFLFLVVCASDVSAYFTGRAFGRRLLAPRISPQKTVEGAAGALVGSLLVGWCFAHWFWKPYEGVTALALSGLASLAGQLGDLAESALKRSLAVKDSSGWLPGHGGLLDRLDSLLTAAPAVWLAVFLGGL